MASDPKVPLYDLAGKRIWIAGHRGMVGQALTRRLQTEECILLSISHEELDLRVGTNVHHWIQNARPDVIIVAAATVGGILANDTRPVDFLYDNLMIAANIVEGAYRNDVQKLLYLGSSCIYPRNVPQPMSEDAFLTGTLEPTNQWYATAKIAGIMLCRAYRRQYGCDFISAMPTNLYGPADNYDLQSSHVVPALIAKSHAAKAARQSRVVVWGSGAPRREFMYVDDLADALVFLLQNYSDEQHVNIGVGYDVTVREVAELIMRVVGIEGQLLFDASKPDGAPRKLLDSRRLLSLGWRPCTGLEEGLQKSYRWFVENVVS